MRAQRGFTLIETLAGLLILTLIVTTSLAIFYERQLRLRRAEETIVVYQALANESEALRRISFAQLTVGTHSFVVDRPLMAELPDAVGSITISDRQTGVREVVIRFRWQQQKRSAQMTLLRTDTGGENLW